MTETCPQPNDVFDRFTPMTPEQADAEYDAAPAVPISAEEIDALVEKVTAGNKPCRQCGVGHHRHGKCDRCGVSEEYDDSQYKKWLKKKKRNQDNADLWRS